jgi:hypothetical protein
MNKDEIIQILEEHLVSEETIHQFDLTLAPLLEKEKEDLRRHETNWQSYILSSLVKSPLVNENTYLFYHWRVGQLEPAKEAKDYFCGRSSWVGKDKWCQSKRGRCWEKKNTEFDAVLKDHEGNWLAIFEFEDAYNSCCHELCNMFKLARWLETQQTSQPLFCLFYWLPITPKQKYTESRTQLKEYIKFVNKHMYNGFRGTRFVFVLQSGPNDPQYAITKTRVMPDKNDFSDVEKILKKEFESS